MLHAVLFDLDGLMVDSEPHSLASWDAVLATRGIALEQVVIERMFGQRLIDTARMLVQTYHLPDRPEELAREKETYQIAHLPGRITPMPGLLSLLDAIEQRGLRKAVASSGMRCYVTAVLKEVCLTERFPTIVTGDVVTNGKPAPDIFLAAARMLHIEPRHCLVLEDAPSGVQAAKAAGMRCVAVPNVHTQSLDLSLADWRLPSLTAVGAQLEALVAD
jgi:HAD superfamily hydrolase (TIGR01509 family)